MSRDPLRVLTLLPLLLASIYISVAPVGIVAAQEVTGDSTIVAPTVATHSAGPNPGHSLPNNNLYDITITAEDVGPLPEDMDGWNLVGSLDPAFFTILAVQNAPGLGPECTAMGGSSLYSSSVNQALGTWSASELCFVGLPHPTDSGATGSVSLATLQLRVKQIGCSTINLDESNSFLRDVDGFSSAAIPATVLDGTFCNTPDFSAGFSGQAATVSPRRLSLGGDVRFHANVQSNGAVSMIVEFKVLRPDAVTDRVVCGPVAVAPNTGTSVSCSYTPPKVGFYSVQATAYWSEDGGMNYLYADGTQSRNLDFTVR